MVPMSVHHRYGGGGDDEQQPHSLSKEDENNGTPAAIGHIRNGGDWGQLSTPTPSSGGVIFAHANNAGYIVSRGQAVLGIIAAVLIFSQIFIICRYDQRSSGDLTRSAHPANGYFQPPELSGGRSLAGNVSLRGEMGYLDVTIPERLVELLQQPNEENLLAMADDNYGSTDQDQTDGDENFDDDDEEEISESGDKIKKIKPFRGFKWLRRQHQRRQSPYLSSGDLITVDKSLLGDEKPVEDWDNDTNFELIWTYSSEEKLVKYVGSKRWMKQFRPGSRQWLNSVAVFPHSSSGAEDEPKDVTRQHGLLGVYPNGTQAWKPGPTPPLIGEVTNRTEAMHRGGFYLELSNSMPMDRMSPDHRDEICLNDEALVDYQNLDDVSIIITFFNEPLSTLLRSVHSVLNLTPPSLIREIILVDDYSDLPENMPGSDLYEYIKLLPKVTILRLTERRGLVWARLAGTKHAKAPVYVILDSHIEVNRGWLEPQLQRIKESPQSIVFPQIMALDADTLEYNRHSGIGCWLSWKWNMIEQASLTGGINSTAAIASPSMAGGLFAVHRDWFWKIGGYDEGFAMWGSENVEMGFRSWMCGGRLECTPCARTFHIYRQEGFGYTSPHQAVIRNKLRTARLWMDEYYEVAKHFAGSEERLEGGIGNLDRMIEMKERLKCKDFQWFLKEVDPTHEFQNLDEIEVLGEIRNRNKCIDAMNHNQAGEAYDLYSCHGLKGNQGWLKGSKSGRIHSLNNERNCLSWDAEEGGPIISECTNPNAQHWRLEYIDADKKDRALLRYRDSECLTARNRETEGTFLYLDKNCSSHNNRQVWQLETFSLADYEPLDYSPSYKSRQEKTLKWDSQTLTDTVSPGTSSTEAAIPL